MHPTAMLNGKMFFDVYGARMATGTVVDVGAQDVNGSLREVCPPHLNYVGVDFVAGTGVDVVLDDPYRLPFADASVDVVVSSSCFEHAEMFWLPFLEIMRVLKSPGLFYLNAPSNGEYHRYPVDCWRFYPDSGKALTTWACRSGYDAVLLESYTCKQIGDVWNDFVAAFSQGRRLRRHLRRAHQGRLRQRQQRLRAGSSRSDQAATLPGRPGQAEADRGSDRKQGDGESLTANGGRSGVR